MNLYILQIQFRTSLVSKTGANNASRIQGRVDVVVVALYFHFTVSHYMLLVCIYILLFYGHVCCVFCLIR